MIYHDVSMKGSGKVHLHTPFSQAQNSLKHKLNHPLDSISGNGTNMYLSMPKRTKTYYAYAQ